MRLEKRPSLQEKQWLLQRDKDSHIDNINQDMKKLQKSMQTLLYYTLSHLVSLHFHSASLHQSDNLLAHVDLNLAATMPAISISPQPHLKDAKAHLVYFSTAAAVEPH